MKYTFIFILISVFAKGDINKIAKINKAKHLGETAYANGDYKAAISAFRYLTDTLGVKEDPVMLNLANAYFKMNDTTNAVQFYGNVARSDDAQMKSLAYQQLGVINQQKNKLKEAISNFKSSLMSNPGNEEARYNYELLKKMLAEQEQQDKDKNEDIEPSEYAKQLKAKADALVRQNLFANALNIMQMGLKEDKTVAAYNGFINKLNDVVESKKQP